LNGAYPVRQATAIAFKEHNQNILQAASEKKQLKP